MSFLFQEDEESAKTEKEHRFVCFSFLFCLIVVIITIIIIIIVIVIITLPSLTYNLDKSPSPKEYLKVLCRYCTLKLKIGFPIFTCL